MTFILGDVILTLDEVAGLMGEQPGFGSALASRASADDGNFSFQSHSSPRFVTGMV